MENLEFSEQGVFDEVINRGRNAAAVTREAFEDLLDEVVEEHRRIAEMDDDQDTTGIYEQLRERFEEYLEALQS